MRCNRLTSASRGTLSRIERLVGEQARDHQRQRGVLRPRDRYGAVEALAADDANAIHHHPRPPPPPVPDQPPHLTLPRKAGEGGRVTYGPGATKAQSATPLRVTGLCAADPLRPTPCLDCGESREFSARFCQRLSAESSPGERPPARPRACALRRLRFSRSAARSRSPRAADFCGFCAFFAFPGLLMRQIQKHAPRCAASDSAAGNRRRACAQEGAARGGARLRLKPPYGKDRRDFSHVNSPLP